jgi:diguanylate cyclase
MRFWLLALGAVVATVGFGFAVSVADGTALGDVVSDLGQLLAAAGGAVGCAVAARRSPPEWRTAWTWLAIGTGCWAAGQAVWSWYELVAGRAVPFPSLADVGFLVYPLAAGFGMVLWLGAQDSAFAKGRFLLDGLLVAGSLLALSWVTVLGPVIEAGPGDDWLGFGLSLGYPVGDVVIATLALTALARGRHEEQATLVLLTLGLLGVSCSDSAFLYLSSTEQYSSTDVIANSGWFLGFTLIGLAGSGLATSRVSGVDAGASRPGAAARSWSAVPARLRVALPYVPLTVAAVVLADGLLDEVGAGGSVLLLFAALLVAVMMLRQFLAVLDNQRLLAELGEARDALQHQASHDALTGLPNRTLFAQRLDRSLVHARGDLTVLFCDLNDFKPVNDRLGHEVGDTILCEVAARLSASVRGVDTVARMGGDEFAILLENGGDASQVVSRIADALALGVHVAGEHLPISMSVGRAYLPAATGPGAAPTAEERAAQAAALLRHADLDMYDVKATHRERVESAS